MRHRDRRTPQPVVDLSIDWDFFSRELLLWDWGHGEGGETGPLYLTHIWQHRYTSTIDLRAESSLERADFMPNRLLTNLVSRNVTMSRRGVIGAAESHVEAYAFLLDEESRSGPPDVLLHIDAHHDCYSALNPDGTLPKLHCGNWVQHYMEQRPTVQVLHLNAAWQEMWHMVPEGHEEAERGVRLRPEWRFRAMRWKDWGGFTSPYRLRNVFVCRSGAWVPPHHDEAFGDFLRLLALGAKGHRMITDIIDRTELIPSDEEIAAARKQWEEVMRGPVNDIVTTTTEEQQP